jgi:hypothetical protein
MFHKIVPIKVPANKLECLSMYVQLLPYHNKLECLPLPYTSTLVLYLQANMKPSRVEPSKGLYSDDGDKHLLIIMWLQLRP